MVHRTAIHRVFQTLRLTALFAAVLGTWLLVTQVEVRADEPPSWGEWRGPARNGHADAFGTLGTEGSAGPWPAAFTTSWTLQVGEGQSSPLVVGNRVLLFDREDGEERLTSFDAGTGKIVWQQGERVHFRPGMGGGKYGAGPKSTPATTNDQIVTYGVTSIITVRKQSDGSVVWRKNLREEVSDPTLYWGNSMSPVIVDGLVVVQYGGDKGGILAYRASDGSKAWSIDGFGSSYASPIVVNELQEDLVLMAWTGPLAVSRSGDVLWQMDFPMTFSRQNTPTPVFADAHLVIGGEGRALQALRVTRAARNWNVQAAWDRPDLPLDLASPIEFDGRVCGLTTRRKGQVFCVELSSGEDIFLGPARAGDHATLMVTPQNLLVLANSGELTVLDRDATSWTPLATYQVSDSEVFAHPAVVPRGLIIKSEETLSLIRF